MIARASLQVQPVAMDAGGWQRVCAVSGPDGLTPERIAAEKPDEALVATERGRGVARASLWTRATPPIAGEHIGVIGHFAADSPHAGRSILADACLRLQARGVTLALGPMDGSTWRRYRLVTWRTRDPPFLLEPYTPPAWPAHFLRTGFAPYARYRSTRCDDLAAMPVDAELDARMASERFALRSLDASRTDAELTLLWQLACDAFAHNPLYTPLGEAPFRAMYAPLIAMVPARFVAIAEHRGRPVGFMLSYPDTSRASRGEPADTVVFKTLGVVDAYKRRGVGRWLYGHAVDVSRAAGFRAAINALMHDTNPSRRLAGRYQRLIRRYTLYARAL